MSRSPHATASHSLCASARLPGPRPRSARVTSTDVAGGSLAVRECGKSERFFFCSRRRACRPARRWYSPARSVGVLVHFARDAGKLVAESGRALEKGGMYSPRRKENCWSSLACLGMRLQPNRVAWIVLSIGGETGRCRFGGEMSRAVSARLEAPVLKASSRFFSAVRDPPRGFWDVDMRLTGALLTLMWRPRTVQGGLGEGHKPSQIACGSVIGPPISSSELPLDISR
jgi:hypothetical protein